MKASHFSIGVLNTSFNSYLNKFKAKEHMGFKSLKIIFLIKLSMEFQRIFMESHHDHSKKNQIKKILHAVQTSRDLYQKVQLSKLKKLLKQN